MKFLHILLIPALLLPLFSIAQSNYKPGYVVTIKGDTLKGFINIKEWAVNPKKISFKTSADKKESQEFGVSEITFFKAINLESYQRYIGLLNSDPTDIGNIPTGRNTSTITDSVFLKIIQKGDKITLFEYTDDKKDHYFVADNRDNKPEELVYRIYTEEDGKTINENGYMRQFFALALKYKTDSELLKAAIEKSTYNFRDLVAISRKINNNKEKDDEAFIAHKKGTFFFVSAALNISNISSDNGTIETLTNSTPTSYFPRIAAGINVLANPNVGRLVFRAEAAFTVNKYKASLSYNNGDGIETYSFSQNTLSIIPQVLYNFYNADELKIYGAAGASFNITKYGGNTFYNKQAGRSANIIHDYLTLESGWTSFPLKIGAVLNKKLDFWVSYIPNATFSRNLGYSVQVSAVQVGLNYVFY
ncbi:outer membrane protein [Mucilaginibacter sp. FT3.2]|uniref:outer membrane protein n=1 Tax=Mucilaginibacter sp. FT3.2 TaxID=2723090 RepID=UPI00161641D0|nr:hypothetical protein [Mucilaginibacter sp. FT3.2]MBB6229680.1 hypothetical protein [Mucilaginibacter sp. FT3.2]